MELYKWMLTLLKVYFKYINHSYWVCKVKLVSRTANFEGKTTFIVLKKSYKYFHFKVK